MTRSVDGAQPARRLLLVGVVLLALDLRPAVVAVSPVLDEVQADLGMSSTVAGLLGTSPVISFAVLAALAPAVIRRLGAERSAWVAMLLVAAGQLARAVAPGAVSFLLLSLVALAGMGLGNVVLPSLIRRYFPDRLGAVTSLYVVLVCAGTAIPAQLAVPVSDVAGWRTSVGSWALPALVAAVPWVLQAQRARAASATAALAVDHDLAGDDGSVHLPVTAFLRSRLAWGMAITLGTTSLGTYAMLGWLPLLLAEAGVGRGTAGTMLAVYSALGVPISLLVPLVVVRIRNPYPLVVAAAVLYLSGYAGLGVSPSAGTWVWVCLLGLAPMAFPLVLTLLTLRSRTPEGAAGLAGFVQAVGYALAGLGPFVVGLLHDVTGEWTASLLFLSAVIVPMLVAGVWGCRPVMVEDTIRR